MNKSVIIYDSMRYRTAPNWNGQGSFYWGHLDHFFHCFFCVGEFCNVLRFSQNLRTSCGGPFDHLPHYILHGWWILHILKNLQILLEPSWSSPSLLLNNFSQFLQNSHNSQILLWPSWPPLSLLFTLLTNLTMFRNFQKICNFCRIHGFCWSLLNHHSHYFLYLFYYLFLLYFTIFAKFTIFAEFAEFAIFLGPTWPPHSLPFTLLMNFTFFCNFRKIRRIIRFCWSLSLTTSLTTCYIVDELYIFLQFSQNSHNLQILLEPSWPPLSPLIKLLTNFTIFAVFAICSEFAEFADLVGP